MIRKIAVVITLFLTSLIIAQEKNSLLWQISGNGLTKNSYLYGTMHVSQKIAFHLDDVFYESLLKSDFVGLESDPSSWLTHLFNSPEELGLIRGIRFSNNSDFYNSPFQLLEPKQQEIMFYLSREDMLLNGILYRTNQMMQDFQEDTFLDMFIYQTGKKNGKKIYSLEDYKESSSLVKKATSSSKTHKDKPDDWLQKKLKEDGFLSIMNNAYRDRKINLLDSINKGMYTEAYMKNMLYKRNENMVNSIDSITKKGSLFSAVGAAHLGGEKGVIAMLRERGYTVKPLFSDITKKAIETKKQIDDKVIEVQFREQTAADNFFTAQLPNKMYELNILNNTSYISPDLTNGAYVIITRMNTFSKIHGKDIKDDNFDKLLFESIPGEIISKQEINKQGVDGLDILNKTKTGDFQRYQIFFTPLEVLIFKMDGRKEYVKTFGDTFFNSIKFNNLTDEFTSVSPLNKGFLVDVSAYHTFTNKSYQGNRILQAVDKKDNYYFLKEVTLNDVNYIEEDNFELERIQERFCKNLKLEYHKGAFTKDKIAFESNTQLKNTSKKLFLKTVTNGSHYYLLGYVSKDDKMKNQFFNSFKITNFSYPIKSFERKVDSTLYFSVNTNVNPSFNRYNFNFYSRVNFQHFSGIYTGSQSGLNFNAQTIKRFSFGANLNLGTENKDFFEPRQGSTSGIYFLQPERRNINTYISTNSQKKFQVNADTYYTSYSNPKEGYGFSIAPRYRFTNQFSLRYRMNFNKTNNDQGYVDEVGTDIVFGTRDRKSYTNTVSGKYSFSTNSSLSLSFRHYWGSVNYSGYNNLNSEGGLNPNNTYAGDNVNFNSWNLDLNYIWQFAPGSQLIAFYRNSIFNEDTNADLNFFKNLDNLFDQSQQHTFSVRFVYFIDYNKLKKIF